MSGDAPIIVVGGGIAGLSAALAAAPAPVLLLTRRPGAAGAASTLAQGGIAAALGAGDTPAAHARDTCVAGSHHNDVAMVELLTASAPAAIAWLQAIGVDFDRDADGRLQLGREGGHDRARIAHAGGDGTGAAVMRALVAAARAESRIHRVAGCDVDALALRDGRVVGVSASSRRPASSSRSVAVPRTVASAGSSTTTSRATCSSTTQPMPRSLTSIPSRRPAMKSSAPSASGWARACAIARSITRLRSDGGTARNVLDRLPWEQVPLALRIAINRGARFADAARAAYHAPA